MDLYLEVDMANFNVEVNQNAEISIKLPVAKNWDEQLRIMEDYTTTHQKFSADNKAKREVECLKVLYPVLFRPIESHDWIAGRLDFLPIGFGAVTSVGGVGHYCVFKKLRAFQQAAPDEQSFAKVEALYQYWLNHDTKTLFCNEHLQSPYVGAFIDVDYPMIATARLSGMMLDYDQLVNVGLNGLVKRISDRLIEEPDNAFLLNSIEAINVVKVSLQALADQVEATYLSSLDHDPKWQMIRDDLVYLVDHRPATFHQAIQLFWVYAVLSGSINYGRMDDCLGPFLSRDLAEGLIDENTAKAYLKSLWTLIENRRTTVNGRIICGGEGRKNPIEADLFTTLAIEVTRECRYVEPQFTLRFSTKTDPKIMDLAYQCISEGVTYPTLYNDDVNIPAVEYGLNVDHETAKQYVPFGCGEFVIAKQSVGTPNICINLLKILSIVLNDGVDPMDNIRKTPFDLVPMRQIESFEQLVDQYHRLLDFYLDLAVEAQYQSYGTMNGQVSFLLASILTDDCIERGKSILDGGVRYLGGTNETYGNINVSDSLYAIKKLVFDEKRYDLVTLQAAVLANFEGCETIRKALWKTEKYGNDIKAVDNLANQLYEYVAIGNRERGLKRGMDYFLIVISNNQTNSDWGLKTAASLDGRYQGQYMNPANNPQGGADQSGPTAMLNSLTKFNAKYHGGSVQNIKLSPTLFKKNYEQVKQLFNTYFKRGGCQLMVSVVDKATLLDAQAHPELYPSLIVRVSGFSAIFVNLDKHVQAELLSRHTYE
jgi:pyruvate-formate lyase